MQINILNRFRIGFYISRLEKRTGICSDIANNDKHILLWDFDNIDNPDNLIADLSKIQDFYSLSNIYIVKTSEKNYHAYCFNTVSFQKAIYILASTPNIDMTYLKIGIVRGYFTLRISPRYNEKFELFEILLSYRIDETREYDLSISEYFTSNVGGKHD